MNAASKSDTGHGDDGVFDDAEALIARAQQAFATAAARAVAENDRCGIPTHGSLGGKLVVRQPPKGRTPGQR